MNYDALSKNTIKITLSRQDMKNYALKSDILCKRNAETKKTLAKFLKKFQSESMIFSNVSSERLFLEAFPAEDGGCVLYVSALGGGVTASGKNGTRTQDNIPCGLMMCTVNRLDDMIALCACLSAAMPECGSSLFRMDKDYSLIVSPSVGREKALSRIMEEYGFLSCDTVDIACTVEQGVQICAGNAAAAIGQLY